MGELLGVAKQLGQNEDGMKINITRTNAAIAKLEQVLTNLEPHIVRPSTVNGPLTDSTMKRVIRPAAAGIARADRLLGEAGYTPADVERVGLNQALDGLAKIVAKDASGVPVHRSDVGHYTTYDKSGPHVTISKVVTSLQDDIVRQRADNFAASVRRAAGD